MTAKEYLVKEGFGIDTQFPFETVERLLQNFHQAKSKEEAISEEQAGTDAVTFAKKHELCNEDGAFDLLTDGYMGCYYDHVYRLAAFGKEGEG